MKRFGKKAAGILGVGQSFFAENEDALSQNRAQARLYTAQPRRTSCKICAAPLPSAAAFVKHEIPYAFCTRCGHLNGLHEDTPSFCAAIYADPAYGHYYESKDAAAFQYRVDAVYVPKVRFLVDALRATNVDPLSLRYVDWGAGSGYFVSALLREGMRHATGYEVSPSQTAYANKMVPGDHCRQVRLEDTVSTLATVEAEVVSLIGVLEHLGEPRQALAALRANASVRYVFLCLPLFSFCVFLEMAFPHVYPRHLVCDHTHLFTKSSIAWMAREFGLQQRAEWWFGSDMLDLYRHVLITLEGNAETRSMAGAWSETMKPLIDPMQLVLDHQQVPSEVHLLFEKA